MKRIIFFGLLATWGSAAVLSAGVSPVFFQQERTTRRPGLVVAPGQFPGVVGVPGQQSPDPGVTEEAMDEFDEDLEPNGEVAPPVQPVVPDRPTTVRATRAPRGGMELSFTNAPIDTVINAVMRELGYSYIIDPQVGGTVNLYTMGPVPHERLFELLEQILKMNGQAIVRQDGMYVILPISRSPKVEHEVWSPSRVPAQAAPSQQSEPPSPEAEQTPQSEPVESPPPAAQGPGASALGIQESGPTVIRVNVPVQGSGLEEAQGVISYIIPLYFIPSSDMIDMVKAFLSDGATVVDFLPGNAIIVTDYRRNIEQVLKLVYLLDTQYFDINNIDLIPIRYNKAQEVAEDLAKIFAPSEKGGGVRLVAIERLNSLLVITPNSAVFKEVRQWLDRLDVPSTGTNVKTFVYQVENNTAMNIAEVLGQLYQDGAGLPSGTQPEVRDPETGQLGRPREAGFVGAFERDFSGFQGRLGGEIGPSLAGRRGATQSGIRAVVTGNIKIVVNEFNNSLIIQATEADYEFLLQTIRELDVLPRQVLIEANIYSVELNEELSFGIAAFLERRGAGAENGAPQGPATVGQFSPTTATAAGGLSISSTAFIGSDRQLRAILNTLKTTTNVEVVEAPRLLAMDGMQARINVGAEVPVTTASFGDPLRSGTAGNFINSIQFRPTGTTLLIIPRISASGIVTMELAIEVSSATGTDLTPTINRSYVETSLIMRDNQTVAIAGIMSDSFNLGRSRVPLLGDIPIVGALFGQTTRQTRRNELLFLITPRVIRNLPTATELTLEFRRALRNAYDFILQDEQKRNELIEERRRKELEEQIRRQ